VPLGEENDMPLQRTTDLRQPPTRQGCCHHWVIEPAMRSISIGVCRFCSEEREFSNNMHVRPNQRKGSNLWVQIDGLEQRIAAHSSGAASSAL